MSSRRGFARRARVCRVCGYRLDDVSGRGLHPLCADESEIWWTEHDLADVARMIARRAGAASASRDTVSAVCALLVGDPSNRAHVEAIVSAVLRDAAADPLWRTTANGWRPHLPVWVNPAVVGATVRALVAAKVLHPTGGYVRCTDVASGNRGKPQPVYEVDLSPLESAVTTERPATTQPALDQAPTDRAAPDREAS